MQLLGPDSAAGLFFVLGGCILLSILCLVSIILNIKKKRKVLRSFPERFQAKVTAIEESKDIDALKIEDLVGSLQTS